jgi:hypothetical protein
VLDDAVNVVLLDKCPFPKKISAAGGRVVWDDAGETPNVCFAYYDSGSTPILFGLSNLANGPGSRSLRVDDVATGYVIHCENGYYEGGRGSGSARDVKGNVIRKFKGDAGANHQRNFVDAVFAHDRTKLNAEVQIGHQSTAWCNLADAARRAGGDYNHEQALAVRKDYKPWDELVELIEGHLKKNSVDLKNSKFELGPTLEFDSEKQKFVGDGADRANKFLHREYREQFEVPTIA